MKHGQQHGNYGKRRSEESKIKLRIAAKNRPPQTEETKLKRSNSMKGKTLSDDTRKKISATRKSRVYLSYFGKHLSDEAKRKISLSRKGKTLSSAHKQKISLSSQKEKNHNWQGGKSSENSRIRGLNEYKLWREAVFRRDKYICTWCGARSGLGKTVVLNADHIKPFALFPELRFAIDNGRTLCVPCHKTTENYGGKAIKLYAKLQL